jgi:hypothetical protein
MTLMWAMVGAGMAVVAITAWHEGFVRVNRRRAVAVLRWLQGAIANYGQISSVTWIGPSCVRARLNLFGCAFRQPTFEVRLAPRQMPLRWALWHWRRRQETLVFQANLAGPPAECLEISRLRWSVFGAQRVASNARTLTISKLYISSQPARQLHSSGPIAAVMAARDCEFLAVTFRPTAPHFSATLSLEQMLGQPHGELAVFESLRELAQSSSPSRM